MNNEIYDEIIIKLDYFSELVKYKPEVMENIVIIIPESKYEKLRELFEEFVISNPELKYAEFNKFCGHPLKISSDIDEIYISIEISVRQSKNCVRQSEDEKVLSDKIKPEDEKVLSDKIKPEEQNLIDALKVAPPIKNLYAIIIQDYIQKNGFLSDAAGDAVKKMIEGLENDN